MTRPQPIALSTRQEWQPLQFILTDVDDTLSTDGRLTSDVYAILEQLKNAGIHVIPVTGRPAGWCDMIARFWPVSAVVGENGAFYFRYDHQVRRMTRVFDADDERRARHNEKLRAIRDQVLARVPGAAIAADQDYRATDLAIDFAEDVARLPSREIDRIVQVFTDAGAVAKVSSIHVNGWFGDHDKLTMSRRVLSDEFGVDIDQAEGQRTCAFIGDSPNDAVMFEALQKSVGVANLADVGDRIAALPTWITQDRSGAGFCEFAARVLATRA